MVVLRLFLPMMHCTPVQLQLCGPGDKCGSVTPRVMASVRSQGHIVTCCFRLTILCICGGPNSSGEEVGHVGCDPVRLWGAHRVGVSKNHCWLNER